MAEISRYVTFRLSAFSSARPSGSAELAFCSCASEYGVFRQTKNHIPRNLCRIGGIYVKHALVFLRPAACALQS